LLTFIHTHNNICSDAKTETLHNAREIKQQLRSETPGTILLNLILVVDVFCKMNFLDSERAECVRWQNVLKI